MVVKYCLSFCLLVTLLVTVSPWNNVKDGVDDNESDVKIYQKFLGINRKQHEKFMKNRKKGVHVPKPKKLAHKETHEGLFKTGDMELPDKFDWRDERPDCESLRYIREQRCPNCWASSAAAVMSDRYCLYTGKNIFFSETQLTICMSCNGRCQGGLSERAFQYYTEIGVASGTNESGCIPNNYKNYFTSTSNTTTFCPLKCVDNSSLDIRFGSNMEVLDSCAKENISMADRIAKVKQEVYDYGPVVVYIEAYPDFDRYKSGVYIHDPSQMCLSDSCDGCSHAVRIIGWGIDNATNIPFWKVANQWGERWGDRTDLGTIKIKQGVEDESGVDWFTTWAYPKKAYE